MEVARATSPPIRSSMRRSTPGMGEAFQSSAAACTATRLAKSALRLAVLELVLAGSVVIGSAVIGFAVIGFAVIGRPQKGLARHLGPLLAPLECGIPG